MNIRLSINRILTKFGYVIKDIRKQPPHHLFGLREMDILTVLDIGANKGQFAKSIRTIFPKATIFSFEPQLSVFAELTKDAQADGNWFAHNMALGAKEGLMKMYRHVDHTPSSSLLPSTDRNAQLYPQINVQELLEIRVASLDAWIVNSGVQLADKILIKMDVQGFEGAVIDGGYHIFSRAEAVIAETCVQKLYEGQTSFVELVAKLDNLGFSLQGIVEYGLDESDHVVSFDGVFFRK